MSGETETEQLDNSEIVWLNTDNAARRLGITTRTLYRFIDEGYLPAYRFGRVIRVQQKDIDAYIGECRIRPGDLGHLYTLPNQPEPTSEPTSDDGVTTSE